METLEPQDTSQIITTYFGHRALGIQQQSEGLHGAGLGHIIYITFV